MHSKLYSFTYYKMRITHTIINVTSVLYYSTKRGFAITAVGLSLKMWKSAVGANATKRLLRWGCTQYRVPWLLMLTLTHKILLPWLWLLTHKRHHLSLLEEIIRGLLLLKATIHSSALTH
ncbi:unnamed protein product [Rodentolepis nana]|uniref:Ovule protein n=1 Tax=Rodentolepis nana TaxID=102285 RepID=A0A0R3TUI8_RODNA|nr:unnamed protein product [Rodentolepis nana]